MNNYTNGRNSYDTYYNHIVKIDHNLSGKQRFYVRANVTRNLRVQDQRHHDAVGHLFFRYNRGAAIDHVYTISPQFIINTRYSYTRFIDGNNPDQVGWDLAGLGFAPSFISQVKGVDPNALRLPRIDVTGYSSLSTVTLRRTPVDRKSTRLNSSHSRASRMPSSA